MQRLIGIYKIFSVIAATFFAIGCGQRYDSVNAEEFAKFLENPEVQLIDTRSPEEFNKGHIPGTINIHVDSEDFYDQMNTIDKLRPAPYIAEVADRARSLPRDLQEADMM